jgi:hypothetical protein
MVVQFSFSRPSTFVPILLNTPMNTLVLSPHVCFYDSRAPSGQRQKFRTPTGFDTDTNSYCLS